MFFSDFCGYVIFSYKDFSMNFFFLKGSRSCLIFNETFNFYFLFFLKNCSFVAFCLLALVSKLVLPHRIINLPAERSSSNSSCFLLKKKKRRRRSCEKPVALFTTLDHLAATALSEVTKKLSVSLTSIEVAARISYKRFYSWVRCPLVVGRKTCSQSRGSCIKCLSS